MQFINEGKRIGTENSFIYFYLRHVHTNARIKQQFDAF